MYELYRAPSTVVVIKKSIGTASLMFLIFMTLKLCGVIGWSWVWVTFPLWAGVGAVVAVATGFLLLFMLIVTIGAIKDKLS